MIELLRGFPNNVVAVSVSGEVTKADYDKVVVPAVDRALAQNDALRLYYQVASDFTGFEIGAMWADAKVGMGHFHKWERIAVVTDIEWLRLSVMAFGFIIPAQVNVYPTADAEGARKWISAT